MTIEKNKSFVITQFLTEISDLWLWASFMYFFEIILLKIVEFFIDLPFNIMLICILVVPLLGIIGYYIAHNNYIKEYTLYLNEKSDKVSKPITIIHISDLHIGSIRKEKTIRQTVNSINSIAKKIPNQKVVTIISGDVADGSCPINPDTFMTFKEAVMPVIFTPGNHDYYPGIDNVKTALVNAGIIILDNNNLMFDNENINVIGMKFSFNQSEQESYNLPIRKDMNNVLIYHVPLYWEQFSKIGVDLELSGHTHGGQFYPVNFFIKKFQFKYIHGLYKRQVTLKDNIKMNSYLSVTEGVGTFLAPIRLGTHSEIVVLTIKRIPKK